MRIGNMELHWAEEKLIEAKEEIYRLRDRLDELRVENERLQEENHQANAECDAKIREINHLSAENERLRTYMECVGLRGLQ